MGRAFAPSYLAGDPAANAFFAATFFDADARIARVQAAARRRPSAELLQILADQQAALPQSSARQAAWDMLASGKAAAVVTGQQVGLFLGPLYSFYKAASAIAVARTLHAESGIPCVPVFWLQTEDHDFDEIRTATVADSEGEPLRLELGDDPSRHARISVAYRSLPSQVNDLLDALAHAFASHRAAEEVVCLLRNCYRPGVGVAEAFACLLATLFADEGLVVFNPQNARVAALAAPLYRRSIDESAGIEAALHEREAMLRAAGFDVQVPIRDQGALVFFHRDDATGPRFRLQQVEGSWQLAGTSERVTHAALLDMLTCDPLRFSTSALLRPILQDLLFPTAAYVAGPGEINYYAQLGPLYAQASLPPPLLIPRGRFVVVDARTRRRLSQLGLAVGDIAMPAHTLRARLRDLPGGAPSVDELRHLVATRIEPTVEEIAAVVERVESSLHRPAQRTRESVARALDRLLNRYAYNLLQRDGVTQRRLGAVELALFPNGVPQERFYAWPSMAARLGIGAFKDLVMQRLISAGPFATEVHELCP